MRPTICWVFCAGELTKTMFWLQRKKHLGSHFIGTKIIPTSLLKWTQVWGKWRTWCYEKTWREMNVWHPRKDGSLFELTSCLSSSFLCFHLCVVCVCVSTWRLKVIIRCLPSSPPYLFFWDKFFYWTQNSAFCLEWMASESVGPARLFPLPAGLQTSLQP